jgi:hypothetical protein
MTAEFRLTSAANLLLQGKQIQSVRYMTESEAEGFGWYKRPVVIVLNDGLRLIASMDDEGNDGGSLFWQDDENDGVICTL